MNSSRLIAQDRGVTLVELFVVVFLLTAMAGLALPVAHRFERRAQEIELRRNLREMRRAIDAYHYVVQTVPSAKKDATAEDWPEDLDVLVEGLDLGLAKELKVKFLRRIPRDPLTGGEEWGKRSNKQDPDDDMWDSQNVYDVFSLAEGKALDGTEYKTW
ncbi:MAG: type II secretion system GspH family protein [Acidobacteria bacterium]|nr:type II secretion system GspH family protein [Acidobacteriota bacterium]